jgi:hypothetical protein
VHRVAGATHRARQCQSEADICKLQHMLAWCLHAPPHVGSIPHHASCLLAKDPKCFGFLPTQILATHASLLAWTPCSLHVS